MKQVFDRNGREIIVEDGIVKSGDKTINGYRIMEISEASRPVQEAVRKSNIDTKGHVYFGGAVIPREIAECAIAQQNEIRAAEKRNLEINVPGLDVLKDAINKDANAYEAFQRAMERGDGRLPNSHPVDVAALRKQYPRAAAYLKAEAYEAASHYAKSAAGKKAKDAIAAGADAEEAIKIMEAEWSMAANATID
jgi:hypothetical protein